MTGDQLRLSIATQKEFQLITHNMSLANNHSKTVQTQLRSIHEEVGFNRGDMANRNASEEGQSCFCNLILWRSSNRFSFVYAQIQGYIRSL